MKMEISHFSWKTAGKVGTDKLFRKNEFGGKAIRPSVSWQQRDGNSFVEEIKTQVVVVWIIVEYKGPISCSSSDVGRRRHRRPSSGNRTSFPLISCGVKAAAIRGE
jgi:hypothetical protein